MSHQRVSGAAQAATPVVQPARWLPERGVLLHVGPPKTGTTAIQTALSAARTELEEQGIRYPVRGRTTQHGRAAGALLGRRMAGSSDIEPEATWQRLVRHVAARPDRAVVSSELFADLTAEHISRAVADLGADDLHVLITLRPLEALLASVWQQDIKGGRPLDLEVWLRQRLGSARTGQFWLRQGHDQLVDRWAAAVGPERVCVLIVDSAAPDRLLRDSEGIIGIAPGTLQPQLANRSLSAQEAELLREFHERLGSELSVARYQQWIRLGAFRSLVENREVGPSESRIVAPAWARRRAREIHRPMVERVLASGAHVVGDPEVLLPDDEIPDVVDLRDQGPATVPVDAAVEFALGLMRAAQREADRTPTDPTQPPRAEPDVVAADQPARRRRLPRLRKR